ncbi:ParB-like nuclease domain-containing protein [Bradyrhizobium sp. Rc2d]|uniref:ParB/Srx family N-terminal domain-containing protein n=1 Tax=Bradyrhizobium sp. Rc2d TaxID=1855321 RepID=UPI000889E4D5|nr:ParB/Srx family N-terminal domain-containing protein [Bradyrhizobium sp. Rc2d]SDI57979.1 ParB-like nuclease domain-containing protein [Bradyrhizobium sp. Rc2d]
MDALASKPAVETWPVDRLRPYERNSRRHSAGQIEQIAASIRHWGWTMPILAADDGMVLAGHGRLAAGKLPGFTEVPVIVARGWTDQQKRAYVIADNRLTDASD